MLSSATAAAKGRGCCAVVVSSARWHSQEHKAWVVCYALDVQVHDLLPAPHLLVLVLHKARRAPHICLPWRVNQHNVKPASTDNVATHMSQGRSVCNNLCAWSTKPGALRTCSCIWGINQHDITHARPTVEQASPEPATAYVDRVCSTDC